VLVTPARPALDATKPGKAPPPEPRDGQHSTGEQEQGMGSPEPITTGTHARVNNLEADVRELRGDVHDVRASVQTIQLSVQNIAVNMARLSESYEASAREATASRRKTAADLKCMHDSVERYLPMLERFEAEAKTRAERGEKIKTHLIGWGVVTGISGAGYAAWEAAKALAKTWLRNGG